MLPITHIINELLEYMGYKDADVQAREVFGRVSVEIKLPEARELIGEKGSALVIFQHISRRIVSRQVSPLLKIDIDINGYKKIREGVLKDFAVGVGERVRSEQKTVELDPMPSFDRRIIHLALGNFTDITTESIGEGDSRYIVVRPHHQ